MVVQRLVFDFRLKTPHLCDIDENKLKLRNPQLLVVLGPFYFALPHEPLFAWGWADGYRRLSSFYEVLNLFCLPRLHSADSAQTDTHMHTSTVYGRG